MGDRGATAGVRAQHARDFLDPLRGIERFDGADRAAVRARALGDTEVMVGMGGHLRQVRDRQHLPVSAEGLHQAPDGVTHDPTDARVDFVEDQRGRSAQFARGDGDGEREPREFTARGDLGDRLGRTAGMARDEEDDIVDTGAGGRLEGADLNLEAAAFHAEGLHPAGDLFGKTGRGGTTLLGEFQCGFLVGRRGRALGLAKRIEVGRGLEFGALLEPARAQRRQVLGGDL